MKIFIFSSLILLCCGSLVAEEIDWFPNDDGNTWVFEGECDGHKEKIIWKIDGTVKLSNGKTVQRIIETYHAVEGKIIEIDTFGLLKTERGVTLYWGIGKKRAYSYMLLEFPVETGNKWGNYEIEGFEEVTTPAGTFKGCCNVWYHAKVGGDANYYYAPNVGPINRMVDYFEFRLASFSIKGVDEDVEAAIEPKKEDILVTVDTTKKEELAIIKMKDGGEIFIKFYFEDAPKTVENFIMLAQKGFYDGLTFHRIIPDFIIQGGDPVGTGDGTAGYTIAPEFNDRPFKRGTLGMARGTDPNSGSCQFFICLARSRHLDNQYTAFGEVIKGMDVVDRIGEAKTYENDKPLEPVIMESVEIGLLESK